MKITDFRNDRHFFISTGEGIRIGDDVYKAKDYENLGKTPCECCQMNKEYCNYLSCALELNSRKKVVFKKLC